jgi:hypothetical protein
MVLLEKEAEKVALSSLKEGRRQGTSRNGLKSVINGNGCGETPFTESDVREIYEERYDFFRNELKLTEELAKARAAESTEVWRREAVGVKRE